MKQPLAQETNKIDFFETSEEEILNNTKIKTCLVETNIDIYNDMARVILREHKNSNITVSKNVLRGYIDF